VNPQNYAQYYKSKLESGLLFQDFVVDVCWQRVGLAIVQFASKAYQQVVGESRTGAEIKNDQQYAKTSNLWIELGEKARPRSGDYAPSGINREDNAWLYIIGNYDIFFIFSKQLLKLLGASGKYTKRENGTKTSVGFLLPHEAAMKYAALVVYPMATDEVSAVVGDLAKLGKELHALVMEDGKQLKLFEQVTA